MLEKVLSNVLDKVLGKYVKGISSSVEALKLSAIKGNINLNNLELKDTALDELSLPMSVKYGSVGRLQIRINWKKIATEPFFILVEDVFIVAAPHDVNDPPSATSVQRELENKLKNLEKRAKDLIRDTAILREVYDVPPPVGKKKSGANMFKMDKRVTQLVEKLFAVMVNNLHFEAQSVHFRYEDGVSSMCPDLVHAAGITLRSVKSVTSVDKERDRISKGVDTKDFAVYFTPNCASVLDCREEIGSPEWVQRFSSAIHSGSKDSRRSSTVSGGLTGEAERKNPLAFGRIDAILAPISASVSIFMSKSVRPYALDPPQKWAEARCDFGRVDISVNEEQYSEMTNCGLYLLNYNEWAKVRHLRPNVSVSKSPLAWWTYATKAVTLEWSQNREKESIEYFAKRSMTRKRYIYLYRMLQPLPWAEPLSDAEKATIAEELLNLNEELDYHELLCFQAIALKEISLEARHREYKRPQKDEGKKSRKKSIMGKIPMKKLVAKPMGMMMLKNKNRIVPSMDLNTVIETHANENPLSSHFTEEEQREIDEMAQLIEDEQETISDNPMPPGYLMVHGTLRFHEISVNISAGPPTYAPLVEVCAQNLVVEGGLMPQGRPGMVHLFVAVSMSSISAYDRFDPHCTYNLISSTGSDSENSKDYFTARVEVNPLDTRANLSIQTELLPLRVVVGKFLLHRLMRFAMVPKVTTNFLLYSVSSAKKLIPAAKSNGSRGVSLSTNHLHQMVELDLDIRAPTIIFPATCKHLGAPHNEVGDATLIIDCGHLKVTSDKAGAKAVMYQNDSDNDSGVWDGSTVAGSVINEQPTPPLDTPPAVESSPILSSQKPGTLVTLVDVEFRDFQCVLVGSNIEQDWDRALWSKELLTSSHVVRGIDVRGKAIVGIPSEGSLEPYCNVDISSGNVDAHVSDRSIQQVAVVSAFFLAPPLFPEWMGSNVTGTLLIEREFHGEREGKWTGYYAAIRGKTLYLISNPNSEFECDVGPNDLVVYLPDNAMESFKDGSESKMGFPTITLCCHLTGNKVHVMIPQGQSMSKWRLALSQYTRKRPLTTGEMKQRRKSSTSSVASLTRKSISAVRRKSKVAKNQVVTRLIRVAVDVPSVSVTLHSHDGEYHHKVMAYHLAMAKVEGFKASVRLSSVEAVASVTMQEMSVEDLSLSQNDEFRFLVKSLPVETQNTDEDPHEELETDPAALTTMFVVSRQRTTPSMAFVVGSVQCGGFHVGINRVTLSQCMEVSSRGVLNIKNTLLAFIKKAPNPYTAMTQKHKEPNEVILLIKKTLSPYMPNQNRRSSLMSGSLTQSNKTEKKTTPRVPIMTLKCKLKDVLVSLNAIRYRSFLARMGMKNAEVQMDLYEHLTFSIFCCLQEIFVDETHYEKGPFSRILGNHSSIQGSNALELELSSYHEGQMEWAGYTYYCKADVGRFRAVLTHGQFLYHVYRFITVGPIVRSAKAIWEKIVEIKEKTQKIFTIVENIGKQTMLDIKVSRPILVFPMRRDHEDPKGPPELVGMFVAELGDTSVSSQYETHTVSDNGDRIMFCRAIVDVSRINVYTVLCDDKDSNISIDKLMNQVGHPANNGSWTAAFRDDQALHKSYLMQDVNIVANGCTPKDIFYSQMVTARYDLTIEVSSCKAAITLDQAKALCYGAKLLIDTVFPKTGKPETPAAAAQPSVPQSNTNRISVSSTVHNAPLASSSGPPSVVVRVHAIDVSFEILDNNGVERGEFWQSIMLSKVTRVSLNYMDWGAALREATVELGEIGIFDTRCDGCMATNAFFRTSSKLEGISAMGRHGPHTALERAREKRDEPCQAWTRHRLSIPPDHVPHVIVKIDVVNDHVGVDIVLNRPRCVVIPSLLFDMLAFASSLLLSFYRAAVVEAFLRAADEHASLQIIKKIFSRKSPGPEEIAATLQQEVHDILSIKLCVQYAQVYLLETEDQEHPPAIVGELSGICKANVSSSRSIQVDMVGRDAQLLWAVFGSESETALSIVEPFSCRLSSLYDYPSEAGHAKSLTIDAYTEEIQVRASYQDTRLLARMLVVMSRASFERLKENGPQAVDALIKTLKKVTAEITRLGWIAEPKPLAAVNEDEEDFGIEQLPPQLAIFQSLFDNRHIVINCSIQGMNVLVVNDVPGMYHPLFNMGVESMNLDIDVIRGLGDIKGNLSGIDVRYFNILVAQWEHLVKSFNVKLTGDVNAITGPLVECCASIVDEVTVILHDYAIDNIVGIALKWLGDLKTVSLGASPQTAVVPYSLHNFTDVPIRVTSSEGPRVVEPLATHVFEDMNHFQTDRLQVAVEFLGQWQSSNVVHMNLGRAGAHVSSLHCSPREGLDQWCTVVSEVNLVDGSKIVEIKSPMSIQNRTGVVMEVHLRQSIDGVEKSDVIMLDNNTTHHLPLYCTTAEYGCTFAARPCGGTDLGEEIEISHEDFARRKAAAVTMYSCSSPVNKSDKYFTMAISVWGDQVLTMALLPPIVIENLTTEDVYYSISQDKKGKDMWRGHVKQCCSSCVHTAIQGSLLNLHFDSSGLAATKPIILSDLAPNKPKSVKVAKEGKNMLRLCVDMIEDSYGTRIIRLYFPYIFINHSRAVLYINHKDESIAVPPSPFVCHHEDDIESSEVFIPIGFGHSKKNSDKVTLQFEDTSASNTISLDTGGRYENVHSMKCIHSNSQKHISVYSSPGIGRFCRSVIFRVSPRYVIVNATDKSIYIRQEGYDARVIEIPPFSQPLPFFWPSASAPKRLQISYSPDIGWSAGCNLDVIGSFLMKTGADLDNLQEISLSSVMASQVLRFCNTDPVPQYLIVNNTSCGIYFRQKGYDRVHTLAEGQTKNFAMDNPFDDHTLIVYIFDTKKSYNMKTLATYKEYSASHPQSGRVLQIQTRVDILHTKFRLVLEENGWTWNEGAHDVEITPSAVRSFTGDHNHDEDVAPADSIEPSSVEGEVINEDEVFLDDDFIVVPRVCDIFRVSGSIRCLSVTVYLKGEELVNATVQAINAKADIGVDEFVAGGSIGWIQLDNQIPYAMIPVIFFPDSVKMKHEHIFLSAEISRSNKHWSLDYINYAQFQMVPFILGIDAFIVERMLVLVCTLPNLAQFLSRVPIARLLNSIADASRMEFENIFQEPTSTELRQNILGDVTLTISTKEGSKRQLYMHSLMIHPIKFHFTIKMRGLGTSTNQEAGKLGSTAHILALPGLARYFVEGIGAVLGNLEYAPVSLNALLVHEIFENSLLVGRILSAHYKTQVFRQIHRLLGSSDAIGNPVGLLNHMSAGWYDFFYEPSHGPEAFLKGLKKGTVSFTRHHAYGVLNSTAGITGSIATTFARLSLDKDWMRQAARTKNSDHRIRKSLKAGIIHGVTDVVQMPKKGNEKGGFKGMIKGVGKGAVGLITKPATAIFDAASDASYDAREWVNESSSKNLVANVRRIREPRNSQGKTAKAITLN